MITKNRGDNMYKFIPPTRILDTQAEKGSEFCQKLGCNNCNDLRDTFAKSCAQAEEVKKKSLSKTGKVRKETHIRVCRIVFDKYLTTEEKITKSILENGGTVLKPCGTPWDEEEFQKVLEEAWNQTHLH